MTSPPLHAPRTRTSLPHPLRRPALYILAGLTLVTGILFTGLPSASAYDCPPGKECHFVRITQKGLPSWAAKMTMFNREKCDSGDPWNTDKSNNCKIYNTWREDYGRWGKTVKAGAYVSWWWQLAPRDTTTQIDIEITSSNVRDAETPSRTGDWSIDPHQDHCYMIDALGYRKWTGSGVHDEQGNWVGEGKPCTDE